QVIILRLHPKIIGERLRNRGYSREKVSENVEAELVDVCLIEAIDEHENIIEIDTTGKTPDQIVEEILELLNKGIKKRIGIVDWTQVYDEIIPYINLGGE
ncbi:MAG TPA: kinase, partial [Thermococcus paralvinellae]|nr:kinase [Thermococcus paralvinellae]